MAWMCSTGTSVRARKACSIDSARLRFCSRTLWDTEQSCRCWIASLCGTRARKGKVERERARQRERERERERERQRE
jgi:hypothetical protein